MKIAVIGTGLIGSQVPSTPIQPISAAEVAAAVAEVAAGAPLRGTREIAGLFAAVKGDALTASDGAHIAATHYRDWLRSH